MKFRKMGSSPSFQEWRDLYRVAMEFKEVGCWNWMDDSDVFGVQNPEDGEIGYCCVMGMLGEHFALGVYLGTDGLDGYLKIQSEEFSSYPHDLLMFQKCLMASFEDRKFLQKQDLQIIKRLGLKFRGRNSWPLFRSYRPGYYPWFLTDREARFLALALQRSTEVSLRFKEDPDLFTPPKKNHYLVSVSEKGEKGLEWRDEWLKPAPITKRRVKVEMVDEARLRRIEREASRRLGVWETDFLLSPMSVAEKREERPYFPCLFMWVDHYSGLILHIHLTEQPGDLSELPSQLLNLIENIKTIPDRILVRKEDAFRLLKPVAFKLKIKLKLVERLECLEEAMINMLHLLDTRSK